MGSDIQDAYLTQNYESLEQQPVVAIRFTGLGGKRFAKITGENVNKRLAIVLDGIIESAPNIQQKISRGEATITLGGGRSYNEQIEEGTNLSMVLKSGAIPATITVLEQRQVGASLGPELANQGIKGIILGLFLVLIFMIIYYRRPGIIACIALTLNGLLLLAMMAGFGFALTLPGIAGFILTLGMAVDANVLINERIRQEIREGKNARKAVSQGFDKVVWTIVDANITTLIAALVLLETNPSGPIRGFAVTLMIGLLVSLFTSLYCTRFLFDFVLSYLPERRIKPWLLGSSRTTNDKGLRFNFLNLGKPATALCLSFALAVLVTASIRGINFGVDFDGGTEVLIGFKENIEAEEIRTVANKTNVDGLTVQALDGGKEKLPSKI